MATRLDINTLELVEDAKRKCAVPIKLSWQDVEFCATIRTTNDERKANPKLGNARKLEIVKKVSGYAPPGQTTYIMGSSGAGKTSLLNILADRVTSATPTTLSGNVLFNDKVPVNKDTFQKYAAYVMQDDVLFSRFTVKEALIFAARLKLKMPIDRQDRLVATIITDLGMDHI